MAHLPCIGWVLVGGAWALYVCSTSVWICSFLAFKPFLLPSCLFDSTIRSNGCLTLVAWRTYRLLGSCSLPFTPSLGWALLGWRPSPSCLDHVLFFLMFVGLLVEDLAMSLHCSFYIITSLSFLIICGLMGWCSCHASPLTIALPFLGFIGQHSYYSNPFHSSGFLGPFTSSLPLSLLWAFLLNPLGFLSLITTSLPLITFQAYWPLSQPNEFANSFPRLNYHIFTSYYFSGLLAFKPTQWIY